MPKLPDIYRLGEMDNTVNMTAMNWDYYKLTTTAKDALIRSGWSSDRTESTANFEAANASVGCKLFPKAQKFLQSVGGITLEYPHFANPSAISNCRFNPEETCASVSLRKLRLYEAHLKSPVCVIGDENNGYLVLLMTQDGQIFAGYEYDLITVGGSPANAINNLCGGGELPVVEVQRWLEAETSDNHHDFLDVRAVEALKDAGCESALCEFGRTLDPKTFQQRYGGFTIDCICADQTKDKCSFYRNLSDFGWKIPAELAATIGGDASPIGEVLDGGIRLVMTSSGVVFGFLPELPSVIWRFGTSGEQAINALVNGKGGTRM